MLIAGLAIVFTVGPASIVYNLSRISNANGGPAESGAKEEAYVPPKREEGNSRETLQGILEARRAISRRGRELDLIDSMPAGEEKNAAIKKFLWGMNEGCEESAMGEMSDSIYRLEMMIEDIRAKQEEGCGCTNEPKK